MRRTIESKVRGSNAIDGAGVHLVRVLGHNTVKEYDPILMLDSFDSTDPKDYIAGFPMHPHRGIETISYIYKGKMTHRDSLGNEDTISDGEVQWMTAGSGILHEEKLPATDRMLGVQLWLNLPKKDKMVSPEYHSIKNHQIKEFEFENGKLRLLAGKYNDEVGFEGKYVSLDYYDIHINKNSEFKVKSDQDKEVILFTLVGDIEIEGELVKEKTAVRMSKGEEIVIKNKDKNAQVLYIAGRKIDEPISWGGPIVMNTKDELRNAFAELDRGTFLREGVEY